MNKPAKITIGVGLVVAALSWAQAADNEDVYKLPDRAQAYATDEIALQQAEHQEAQAKAEVVKARQHAMEQSLASQQYKEAVDRVDATNKAYQALKTRVQDELKQGTPEYQALLKQRATVDQQLEAARRDSSTPYTTFQDLYAKKETTTNAIRGMEDAAMDKAGGTTARAEWTTACKALDEIKKGQRAQVEAAPEVAAAKQHAAQSQQTVDQLATTFAGSQAAYDEASYQQGKQD